MLAILLWVSAGLGAAVALTVGGLALRRFRLQRAAAWRADAEQRLRSIALAAVDGFTPPPLARDERRVLEDIVLRYSRWVDDRAAFALFFRAGGRVDRELGRLRSHRAWRRAAAAYVLGNTAAEEAFVPLVAALHDRSRDVRAAAARSLGRLGDPRAIDPLLDALASGKVPEGVIAQALLEIGSETLAALARLLAHDDSAVRALGVELVGLLGDAGDERRVVALLSDPAAEVRARAATSLGRLAGREGVLELRRLLGDRVPYVRGAAAEALGAIGDPAAVPELLRTAREDAYGPAHAAALALESLDPAALAAAVTGGHLLEAADRLAAAS